jgi:STAM-binding protein
MLRKRSPSQNTDVSWFEDAAIPSKLIPAAENKELAVRLADGELKRRRRPKERPLITQRPEKEQQSSSSYLLDEDDDHRRRMMETRRRIDGSLTSPHGKSFTTEPLQKPQFSPSTYKYPSIPRPSQFQLPDVAILTPPSEHRFDGHSKDKSPVPGLSTTSSNSSNESRPKPSAYTFQTSAYLEKGTPLRTIFLPSKLRPVFLDIAGPNTRRNLETCGILCGSLISNALFVSRLVIPEQKSTSDTCETLNEGAFFDYCDKEDLLVMGWIHTHPSQTCFMSSRDLHTHSGYQAMMTESIAIVCAPTKNPR